MSERDDWQPIATKPRAAMPILLYFGKLKFRNYEDEPPVEFPPYREERVEVGFWDGEAWRRSGTGHDVFEFWGMEGYSEEIFPTHWQPLPKPPEASGT